METLSDRAERHQLIRDLLARLERHRPGEAGHAQRVAVYAVATGERLGLGSDELLALKESSLLHDLGKLAIDPATLSKPVFDHEDQAAARLHTLVFVRDLPGPQWQERCGATIRGHHERWDGRGYPDGLEGVAIPLSARILAVAEAFDTAASGAGWMAPRGEEEALRMIQDGAGDAFDPRVVQAFLSVQPLIQPIYA